MASGVQGPKQTKGYFVVVSSLSTTLQYNIAAGSGAGGNYLPGAITTQATSAPSGVNPIGSGQYLKDLGKTVVSSSRTFRKVQLVNAAAYPGNSALAAATGAPFYVELPTSTNMVTPGTQLAYLPGLM
jgi:hypothetical protein